MILVFGATGKIGSEVIRLLSQARVPVRAFVRDPAKTKGWSGVEVAQGNLDDGDSVDAALRGIDTVLLLTSASSKQELSILEAAKRAGVKKVVKISSMAADGEAQGLMARGHAEAERALKASGMAFTILQPGMFAQNFLMFAEPIRRMGRFFASVKNGKAAPIDARDIAEVAVKALLDGAHDGKTYVLTGSEALGYADAAAQLGKALGKEVVYVDVPLEQTKKTMVERGIPAWLADELVQLQATMAQTAEARITHDVEQVLGRPARPFADFARDYAAAFK